MIEQWQPRFAEVDLEQLPETGQVHLALLDAGQFLEEALDGRRRVSDGGSGHGVAHRLLGLREELGRHRANIATEGLAEQVTRDDPWLLSHLDHLLQHHDQLDLAIARARDEFAGASDVSCATDRIHRRAKGILATLRTMLSVEHSLIMAQFCEPPARD